VKVVLFCGGQGLRLRDHSEQVPKPMVTVGYRPILWHVMRYYAHFGHREFILCLGYKADHIKDYFLNYQEARSNDFVLSGDGSIGSWPVTCPTADHLRRHRTERERRPAAAASRVPRRRAVPRQLRDVLTDARSSASRPLPGRDAIPRSGASGRPATRSTTSLASTGYRHQDVARPDCDQRRLLHLRPEIFDHIQPARAGQEPFRALIRPQAAGDPSRGFWPRWTLRLQALQRRSTAGAAGGLWQKNG